MSDGTIYDDFDYDDWRRGFHRNSYPRGTYNITLTGYPYAASQALPPVARLETRRLY
jgi:hypothetical protein